MLLQESNVSLPCSNISFQAREAGIAALNRPPWDIAVESDRQRIRELFASFIEADPTDIAIVPSTAFAITMAAKNIQVGKKLCSSL